MTISRIIESDISELKALAKDSLFNCVDTTEEEKQFLFPHILNEIEKAYGCTEHVFLKYEAKGILGYILVKDRWNLSHLFVRPDSLNHGIGRQLFKSAMDEIQSCDNEGYVCLNSSRNAVIFYEKMGFHIDTSRAPKSESTTPMRYDF